MSMRVQDVSPKVSAMSDHWSMITTLLGGTAAMRAAGERYLPKWPNEERDAYESRRQTAVLFPAFERTIEVMSGKPFSKELTLEKVPQELEEAMKNCDLEGHNLHAFSSMLLPVVISYGFAGVLVDMPKRPPEVRTLRDEKLAKIRPYLVAVYPNQILGWQTKVKEDGSTQLAQLRIAEVFEEPDGPFGTKEVRRVRVLEPGKYTLYQETKPDEFTEVESGLTTLSEIPFVPFYARRTGFMISKPPLLNLAYQNVKHWQSQSDQDTLLHTARVPILFMKGVSKDVALTIGGSSAVRADDPDADLKFVEHSGAAIGAGKESLLDLETQMRQTGAELLIIRSVGPERSATESNNDAEANKSDLQRIAESVEDSLDQVLSFCAQWTGQKEGGNVTLFKDFGAAFLSDTSAAMIVTAQQGGLISKQTALNELKRHGTLSPDLDVEKEIDLVEAEGPPLGAELPDGDPKKKFKNMEDTKNESTKRVDDQK